MFYVRGASFWQQDQLWRSRLNAAQQDQDVITAVTSKMSLALTKLSGGMAGIANQRALSRVQGQIKAAIATAVKAGTASASGVSSSKTTSVSSSTTTGNVVNKTA